MHMKNKVADPGSRTIQGVGLRPLVPGIGGF